MEQVLRWVIEQTGSRVDTVRGAWGTAKRRRSSCRYCQARSRSSRASFRRTTECCCTGTSLRALHGADVGLRFADRYIAAGGQLSKRQVV